MMVRRNGRREAGLACGIGELGWVPARRRLPSAETAFRRKATDRETPLMRVQGDSPFLLPGCQGRTDGAKA